VQRISRKSLIRLWNILEYIPLLPANLGIFFEIRKELPNIFRMLNGSGCFFCHQFTWEDSFLQEINQITARVRGGG
jgi:hypothetical protein